MKKDKNKIYFWQENLVKIVQIDKKNEAYLVEGEIVAPIWVGENELFEADPKKYFEIVELVMDVQRKKIFVHNSVLVQKVDFLNYAQYEGDNGREVYSSDELFNVYNDKLIEFTIFVFSDEKSMKKGKLLLKQVAKKQLKAEVEKIEKLIDNINKMK